MSRIYHVMMLPRKVARDIRAKDMQIGMIRPIRVDHTKIFNGVTIKTHSFILGCVGRNNSEPSIRSHGHAGGTRPGQTRKTPKDLSACEREERWCGEGGVCMLCTCVSAEGWDGESVGSEALSLLSYTLRYVIFLILVYGDCHRMCDVVSVCVMS
jgi:hypothetical protein